VSLEESTRIIGRLGGDPELRYLPNGTAVCNFSVATTRSVSKERAQKCPDGWKDSYNSKNWEVTVWWRVATWGGLAENCNKFLAKGRLVAVEGEVNGAAVNGSLYPRIWTAQDGTPRANFELTARQVKFLDRGNGNGGTPAPQAPPPGFDNNNEEIPF
jgi:single-strand DNA-binding protein